MFTRTPHIVCVFVQSYIVCFLSCTNTVICNFMMCFVLFLKNTAHYMNSGELIVCKTASCCCSNSKSTEQTAFFQDECHCMYPIPLLQAFWMNNIFTVIFTTADLKGTIIASVVSFMYM